MFLWIFIKTPLPIRIAQIHDNTIYLTITISVICLSCYYTCICAFKKETKLKRKKLFFNQSNKIHFNDKQYFNRFILLEILPRIIEIKGRMEVGIRIARKVLNYFNSNNL